jgi:hypothetical protein
MLTKRPVDSYGNFLHPSGEGRALLLAQACLLPFKRLAE